MSEKMAWIFEEEWNAVRQMVSAVQGLAESAARARIGQQQAAIEEMSEAARRLWEYVERIEESRWLIRPSEVGGTPVVVEERVANGLAVEL